MFYDRITPSRTWLILIINAFVCVKSSAYHAENIELFGLQYLSVYRLTNAHAIFIDAFRSMRSVRRVPFSSIHTLECQMTPFQWAFIEYHNFIYILHY